MIAYFPLRMTAICLPWIIFDLPSFYVSSHEICRALVPSGNAMPESGAALA
jgi:hypothetical protein